MFQTLQSARRLTTVLLISLAVVSCVTETVESPGAMKFSEASVIGVQDPNFTVIKGSTFAWLPEAVNFYEDKRLENKQIRLYIEAAILNNLKQKEMQVVESVNGASYSIAYTAALESSLDDVSMIKRFGLMPGNANIPQDDENIEKGALIIYVFDNRSQSIIWRSAAQAGVQFDKPMAERNEGIKQVVAEMFGTFKVAPAD